MFSLGSPAVTGSRKRKRKSSYLEHELREGPLLLEQGWGRDSVSKCGDREEMGKGWPWLCGWLTVPRI